MAADERYRNTRRNHGGDDEKGGIDINRFYVTKLLYYSHNAGPPKKSSYIENFSHTSISHLKDTIKIQCFGR